MSHCHICSPYFYNNYYFILIFNFSNVASYASIPRGIYLFIYLDLALDGNKFLQPTQKVKSLQTSTKHGQAPSKNTSRNVMKFLQFFLMKFGEMFFKKRQHATKYSFLKTLHLCEILQAKKYGCSQPNFTPTILISEILKI